MKVSASKKIITILIISFCLFLLAGFSLLCKDVIENGIKHGRWFTVDKYGELMENCEVSNEGNNLQIGCRILLKSITTQDNSQVCLDFQILSNNDEEFIDYQLCENSEIIKTNSEYKIVSGKFLPTNLILSGSKKRPLKYHLEMIELLDVSEQELFTEWYKNERMYKLKDDFGGRIDLVGEYPNKATYEGIELTTYEDYFGEIRLYNAFIKDRYVKDGDIYLRVQGYIDGKELFYDFTIKSKGFFVTSKDSEEGFYINPSNLDEMTEWDRYMLHLVYTTTSMQDNVRTLCQYEVEGLYKNVCIRIDEIGEGRAYENILKDSDGFLGLIDSWEGDFSKSDGLIILNIKEVP